MNMNYQYRKVVLREKIFFLRNEYEIKGITCESISVTRL